MVTKLISANMGMKLVLDVDGQERTVEFSAVCPSSTVRSPLVALQLLVDFVNNELGTHYVTKWDGGADVEFAKPKRIKAPKRVSQDEYNRRIKELQP